MALVFFGSASFTAAEEESACACELSCVAAAEEAPAADATGAAGVSSS
jgi:hypothetical protein